jgi:hypothetical protein
MISVWLLFLRISISLFKSSFIFCVIFLKSYISPLQCHLFHFAVYWSPLWVPLFVSVSSHILYFGCLEISWIHLIYSF